MDLRSWSSEPLLELAMPTMISTEERRYLRWLTRTQWTGAGCVVEIGPWLGGSTACLAAGMRAARREARGRLHVFDNFRWREFMAAKAALPLAPGESFEPYFRRNLGADADLVVSHSMSLPDDEIPGDEVAVACLSHASEAVPTFAWRATEPIEILFLDGAKSWRGLRHLLAEVRASFVPGVTLLACQDYKHWGAYWVAIILDSLREHVEPVHLVLRGSTATFRVVADVPASLVAAIPDGVASVPTEAGLAALERARARLAALGDEVGARRISLARVRFLAHQGHLERAREVYLALARAWPGGDRGQIDGVRDYLEARLGERLPEGRRRSVITRLVRALRRRVESRST